MKFAYRQNQPHRLTRLAIGFANVLLATLAGAQTETVPRVLDGAYLDELRAEVRTNHPAIIAAQARVRAADAGVRSVRLWEDPSAGAGIMFAEREMRRDDGDLLFSAEQVLPRRKLYEARKARAGADRTVREAETRTAALTLETLVAQAAIELALIDEMFALETNQLTWLGSMTANARERLKEPAANASEALRIESEWAQQKQKIDTTARQRVRLTRQLNLLLGRAPNFTWPIRHLPDSTTPTPALADELNRLVTANPTLRAQVAMADAARLEIEVSRRERSPLFSVGVDTSVYSEGDFRQATVGAKVTLPFFNQSVYRANTERARSEKIAAEREVEALERRLRSDAVAAHTEAENAARQAETLSREVIPRTEEAAAATRNAWITSQASILEVLEARRSLLNARFEQRRAVAAHRAALETLRSIVPSFPQP
jgi:cobalt-zinc-cadmium efflux system outer membrane protein